MHHIFHLTVIEDNAFEGYATCRVQGGHHYYTFDKEPYTYEGKGMYRLIQDCSNQSDSYITYMVYVNQSYSCNPQDDSDCLVSVLVRAILVETYF